MEFVVVYTDSDEKDYVEFFDSLTAARMYAETAIEEGYIAAKVFREVE